MTTVLLKEHHDTKLNRQQVVEKFVKTMKENPKVTQITEVVDDGYNVCVYYTCSSFLMADDLLTLQRVVNPRATTHDPIRVVGYRGNYSLTTKI